MSPLTGLFVLFVKKSGFLVSGSQEEDRGEPCITGLLPSSSLANRQQWVAKEHSSCPFVEPDKGCSTRVPASSRHTPGCHKPQASSRDHAFLPHEEDSGECYAAHLVSRSLASAPQSVSVAPSDSATRFSSPGAPPSSGASGSLLSRPSMPLSCVRKSQSCW